MRRLRLEDADQVVELLNEVFHLSLTRDWWKWKYELNPAGFFGEEGDSWVAESSNKIVGHYSVIPVKMKKGNDTILVAQSVDTATHPDFRGLGIFPRLASKVYEETKGRYAFLYGFPSEQAYDGFLRLGWNEFRLNALVKPLSFDRLSERFTRNDTFATILRGGLKLFLKAKSGYSHVNLHLKGSATEVQTINQESGLSFGALPLFSSDNVITVERSPSFLNWRLSRQFGDYKLLLARTPKKDVVGYSVFRTVDIGGMKAISIIDMQAAKNESLSLWKMLETVISISHQESVDIIHSWFPPWSLQSRLMSAAGFFSLRRIPKSMGYLGDRAIIYRFGRDDYWNETRSSWFYSLLDGDYV